MHVLRQYCATQALYPTPPTKRCLLQELCLCTVERRFIKFMPGILSCFQVRRQMVGRRGACAVRLPPHAWHASCPLPPQLPTKVPVQETSKQETASALPAAHLSATLPGNKYLSTLRCAKPAGPQTLNPAFPCVPRPQGSTTLRMLTAEMASYKDRQDIPLKWSSAILEVRALLFRV